ncbi:methyltransferase family protein [Sphaerotilus hippei]|uniref:Methyltransferase family protein n=1 Tax=Sphaerotilus hippei TaxID=744406 RepID=A0A318GVE3_9BURK|nr:methyltransferase domain-containing protein [Sphaerotilus hippei]PXW91875.1 methyltransferase family protein [Sphaerotilus hippei]
MDIDVQHPGSLKIQWLVDGIEGNAQEGYRSSLASNRYRVIFPAQTLIDLGHQVELVSAQRPPWVAGTDKPDVLIIGKIWPAADPGYFQKISSAVLGAVKNAVANGVKVIADFNDDHFSRPDIGDYWTNLARSVDLCVAGSEAMAQALRTHTQVPVVVIGDPLASPLGLPKVFDGTKSARPWLGRLALRSGPPARLKMVWYGHQSNWDAMRQWTEKLLPLSTSQPFSIRILTRASTAIERHVEQYNLQHGPDALLNFQPWSEDAQWAAVAESDIVLVPADVHDARKSVKTANRVTDALHAGRQVIASPLGSYQPFGHCAVLTDDPVSAVRSVISDPDGTMARIKSGQVLVQQLCGLYPVAQSWVRACREVAHRPRHPTGGSTESSAVRLNLGCGDKIISGYVNVDIVESRSGKKPDVLCDLRRLHPFADGAVDEVMAIHVVEHFWRWEVADILREWFRVLKPGGLMVLECPNLLSACQALLDNPVEGARADQAGQRSMWVFYGDPAWQDPLMIHRWGYTPHSLSVLMAEIGLVHIRQEPAQYKLREPRDMRLVGVKP